MLGLGAEFGEPVGEMRIRATSELEAVVATLNRVDKSLDEAGELHELATEEQDEGTLKDVVDLVERVTKEIEVREFRRMFAGKMDAHNAFLDVQSGAGERQSQEPACGASTGISSVALETGVPTIFGVITTEDLSEIIFAHVAISFEVLHDENYFIFCVIHLFW